MNPPSQTIAAVSPPASALALPAERQVALLMQDEAGFVARGLAMLWRERLSGDLAEEYAEACRLIAAGEAVALAACLRDQPELVEYRSVQDGRQLLHEAACHGTPAVIRVLLEQGAPVDSPSGRLLSGTAGRFDPGASPLLLACEAGHSQLALALMEGGADVCAALPAGRETPLHFAAALGMEGLADALIASGADVDALASAQSYDDQLADYAFNTPLHLAALNNQAELVSLLLKSGAQRDLSGVDARSALHYAAARGSVAALEVLLAAGADPDACEHCTVGNAVTRLSPLHYAALNGHQAAVAMLLCYGADPLRIEAASGEDAIRMAERSEDPGLLAMLGRAAKGEAPEAVFSYLDDQYFSWLPGQYAEMRAFLDHLLSEFPLGQRSLLTLSDWLSEVLGPENRPYLARAYRARQNP
jgi:ankyrin repeat protein